MEPLKIKKDFEQCRLSVRFLKRNPMSIRRNVVVFDSAGHIVFDSAGRIVTRPNNPDIGFFTNVQKDKENRDEFTMFIGKNSELTVLDKDPSLGHLLVMVQTERNKEKFLFGHDGRQLFISPLGTSRISQLKEAFETLKPQEVIKAQRKKVRVVRQGEWFFVPAPDFQPPKNSPIRRKENIGGIHQGPHIADELVRVRTLQLVNGGGFVTVIYVRGKIRHDEHSTVEFNTWHKVCRNIENSSTMLSAFVD